MSDKGDEVAINLDQLNRDFEDSVDIDLDDNLDETPLKPVKEKKESSVLTNTIIIIFGIIIIVLGSLMMIPNDDIEKNMPGQYLDTAMELKSTTNELVSVVVDTVSSYVSEDEKSSPSVKLDDSNILKVTQKQNHQPKIQITPEQKEIPRPVTQGISKVQIKGNPVSVVTEELKINESLMLPKMKKEGDNIVSVDKDTLMGELTMLKGEFADDIAEAKTEINKDAEHKSTKLNQAINTMSEEMDELKKRYEQAKEKIAKSIEYLNKKEDSQDVIIAELRSQVEGVIIENKILHDSLIKMKAKADTSKNRINELTKKMNDSVDNILIDISDVKVQAEQDRVKTQQQKESIKIISGEVANIKESKEMLIKSFMSYEMLGFDKTNRSVWIKDTNNNIMKVTKGDYISEYGLVLSISDDATVITKSGILKIKE